MVRWVFGRMCDYHEAFPGGENIPGLLDIMVAAAQAQGTLLMSYYAAQLQQLANIKDARLHGGGGAGARYMPPIFRCSRVAAFMEATLGSMRPQAPFLRAPRGS